MIEELYGEYMNARQRILDYFGEDIFPDDIEFRNDMYWRVDEYDLYFSFEEVDDVEDFTYSQEIFNVYRKEDYTMIRITPCDGGSSYLAIFNNSKEIK